MSEHVDVSEPFVIKGYDFKGCTSTNPDLCACGYAGLECSACREDIRAGQLLVDVYAWRDDDPRGENDSCEMFHADCYAKRKVDA